MSSAKGRDQHSPWSVRPGLREVHVSKSAVKIWNIMTASQREAIISEGQLADKITSGSFVSCLLHFIYHGAQNLLAL